MQENKSYRTHQNKGGNPDFIIEPLLPYGRENSISAVLNLSERELRARVAYERNHGAIICSNTTGGYFRFESREELKAFYKGLQQKADSIYQALRSTKRTLEEIDGQQPINVAEQEVAGE